MLVWILLLTLALPGTMLTALAEGEEPVIEQPAEQPPAEEPPAEEPPVEQPPVEEPQVEQPPVEEPPVEQPPVEEQPLIQQESADMSLMTVNPIWDRSSLTEKGQGGDCLEIYGIFKNVGDRDMAGPTTWELYWSANGNPMYGAKIAEGEIPALDKYDSYKATYNPQDNPNGPNGNYKFKAIQRPGHPGGGNPWTDTIYLSDCVLPDIELTKSVEPTSAMVGETVTYTFVIENTGGKNLYDVELDDNDINFHPAKFGTYGNPFKPGDTKTYTQTFVVTEGCVKDGQFINKAYVEADWYKHDKKYEIKDSATATLTIITPAPAIAISKLVKEVGTDGDFEESIMLTHVPTSVEYKITVTNTGNVPLSNVVVTDPMLPGSPFNVGNLAAGASHELELIPYNFAYGAQFPTINTASAQGVFSGGISIDCIPPKPPKPVVVGPVTDSATVGFEMDPGITLEKTVKLDGSEMEPVDDLTVYELPAMVEYHFEIKNTGNMKLYGIYLLDEKLFGMDVEHPVYLDLDPGETEHVSFDFTVESVNDLGKFINLASVCGHYYPQQMPSGIGAAVVAPQICSMQDDAAVTYVVPGQPAIDIEKTVNDTSVLSGTTVTYTLTVTNTGPFTLYDVLVSDPALSYSTTIPVLEPEAVEVFNINKTLTTADRNDGLNFLNTATATGNTCDDEPEGDFEQATILYPIECVDVTDSDSVSVRITTGGAPGGGGTTTTTTTIVEPEPIPEAVPEVIPAPAPEPAPVILEEAVPLGVPVLPKTGEMNPALFYGLGGALTALGLLIRRKF